MNIQEIRAKYPQYADVSDGDLAKALHTKFYSDMPYQQFEQKVFQTKPLKVGAEGLPDAVKEVSSNFSVPAKFAVGFKSALDDMAMRLKQLTTGGLEGDDVNTIQANRALREESGAALGGNIAGNLAATAVPGAGLQMAGTQLAAKALPAVLAPTVSAAATGGAIAAGTQPVLEGESTLGNAALGAAGSVAGDTAGRVLSRVVQPLRQSSDVQKLVKEGVVPTPGQAAGGFMNRVEQQLESIPVIGWMISGGRGRAVKELDEAAIRKALPAGTTEQIKAGRAGIERAGELLDNAYDAAYARVSGKVSVDSGFKKAIESIPKREGIDLPPSLQKRFNQLVKDRVSDRVGEGAGVDTLRAAHNSLGALSRRYRGSLTSPDDQALGMAFDAAKKELRDMISRQSGGEFKGALGALDKKYAALVSVEKAAGYQGSREGIFSAEALKRASQKSSGEMKDLAESATNVLGRTVPDSGTAGRALLPLAAYAAGGAGAAGNEYLGGPAWVTGALAAPLLYSRAGSRYMVGNLPGQSRIAGTLRDLSPYFSQVGRAATQ